MTPQQFFVAVSNTPIRGVWEREPHEVDFYFVGNAGVVYPTPDQARLSYED